MADSLPTRHQDSKPSPGLPAFLTDTSVSSLPGLSFQLPEASAFLPQSSSSKSLLFSTRPEACPLSKQRFHHKYDAAFIGRTSPGAFKAAHFQGTHMALDSMRSRWMALFLIPCHVSSPDPRWLCSIPKAPAVTPDRSIRWSAALLPAPPSLPDWLGHRVSRVSSSPVA